jgi:Fic family protein
MKRGKTGRYETTTVAAEKVRAFIPTALPPDPPLRLDGQLQLLLEQSLLALGRLDSLSALLPDTSLFLYSYVRKEALLSSQIEGTQSSLSDLLLFELGEAPGVPLDDVAEVSSHVAALNHGLERLRGGFPLSNRLLREIHGVLLRSGRGSEKRPGEFRRSQNWIGGSRPGTARFVPPPPQLVDETMSDLERFLNDEKIPLPILVKAALAHVQFETIHPFLDGNGRLGRLLITFLLCHAGVLQEPILYLSLHFKQHRMEYYELLDKVRRDGDWETWLTFFLEGVRQTADGAVSTTRRLGALFKEDGGSIEKQGRVAGSALRVHLALRERPVSTLQEIRKKTGLSFPAASSGMERLVRLGIARELTGKKRDRVFAYDRYLAILSEGTEPL